MFKEIGMFTLMETLHNVYLFQNITWYPIIMCNFYVSVDIYHSKIG